MAMAKCGSTSVALFRLSMNLVIIAGSAMILYGIIRARSNVNDIWGKEYCLLWAKVVDVQSVPRVETLSHRNCNFSVTGAVVSIVVALLSGIALIYQLVKANSHQRTCMTWTELVTMVVTAVFSVTVVIVLTGGTAVFCGNLRDTSSVKRPCANMPLTNSGGTKTYNWYKDLRTASIGSWLMTGGWLLHLAFSICNCCHYRRSKRVREFDGNETRSRLVPSSVS